MSILLTLILVSNLALLFVILLAFLKIRHAFAEIRGIYDDIQQFVTAPDEKTPSPLAQFVSTIADMIARSMMAQIRTTFAGIAGGTARAEDAIGADIAQAALTQANPILAGLLNTVPQARRMLKKHPELIDAIVARFGGGGNHSTPVITSGESPKFKF